MSTTAAPATASVAPPSAAGRDTAGERWNRLSWRWRLVLIICAAIIVLYFAGSLVNGVYQPPSTTPTGTSSSVDTSAAGTEGMARLLAARGHSVQSLTAPLSSTALPTSGTLFVLDPVSSVTPSLPALEAYLGNGGRLVLGGQIPTSTLQALLGTTPAPVWQASPSGNASPVEHTSSDAGVSTVLGGPSGSWRVPATPHLSVLLQGPGGPLAVDASVGRGTLLLLASTAPLQNSRLAQADDAAFAIDLAGPAKEPTAFDEYDHGLGRSGTGLAGLPTHWKVALGLALLAALVWMWSAARRFGPPQRAERELIPPRVAHVDAMAALLASGSTERMAAAVAPLREQGRIHLRRALRAGADATDEQLAQLAASAGAGSLSPEAVGALLATPRSAAELVDEGRAFVALGPETTRH
ncbi:MAG: DUF4350 domain-containing protein [Acidimicrobiales bacterium]|jgi:alkylhydroperoxidase/carboxymuconolactone decarboxylase family protein YurZ